MKLLTFSSQPDLASFLLRISLGSMFLLHGVGKSLALFPVSLGILRYHLPNGWEYPQFILVGLLVILALGSGRFALTPKQ